MNEIFKEYGNDPIALCKQWFEDAKESEINDPDAVCLATASKNGIPSNRWVLVKAIDEKGFKFHTNSTSQKGQEIEANPVGAMNWYWKSLRKQVRISGPIEQVSAQESDEYFKTRPKKRQIGAWASDQSASFEKWEDLENAIKHYEEKYGGSDDIPRPENWNGYRLIPERLEFWIASRDRLHTRFVYTKAGDTKDGGEWIANWLYP